MEEKLVKQTVDVGVTRWHQPVGRWLIESFDPYTDSMQIMSELGDFAQSQK